MKFIIAKISIVILCSYSCSYSFYLSAAEIMPLHKLDRPRHFQGLSLEVLLAMDSDQDGVANWKTDSLFPGVLFPYDEDIDGDGIKNFFDRDPYDPNVREVIQSHIYAPSGIATIQPFVGGGQDIKFIDYTDATSEEVYLAFYKVLHRGLPSHLAPCLRRLKYVLAYEKMGLRAKGYYLNPIEAIALPGKKLMAAHIFKDKRELEHTIAHEIGHAVVYSCLSGEQLADLARTVGGWLQIDFAKIELNDLEFRKPMSSTYLNETFTSTYAEKGVHEWFAENFAEFVMKQLGYRDRVSTEFENFLVQLD